MDLERLDRDVAAAVADSHDEATIDWEVHRHVAGQRTLRALENESASPLRDALVASVTFLTALRVSHPAAKRALEARTHARVVVRDVEVDWQTIVHGMLAARSRDEAKVYFDAWPKLADALQGNAAAAQEIRQEAFRRLGIDDVPQHFLGVAHRDLVSSAEQLLASTTDLARACTERPSGDPRWPLDLDLRLGRQATQGAWPSRLTWRTAAALLPGLLSAEGAHTDVGPRVAATVCPRAYGAVSFARALFAIGTAFRHAMSPASTPFVIRQPPLFSDGHRTGYLFAAIVGEPAFQRRVLQLAAGPARDQARTLRVAFLLHARALAVRVALGKRGADFEALTDAAFGAPLPKPFRQVWPVASDEDAARFVALLTVTERIDALRDREGDDWFRNPRAFAVLGDLVQTAVKSPALGIALGKRFEELLD